MNTIKAEINEWIKSNDEDLPLGTLCYRVMTMVAYLGEAGKEVHEANDLGTAYAIGYSLNHINIKKNDGAISYIVGAYNSLKKFYRENPLQQGE